MLIQISYERGGTTRLQSLLFRSNTTIQLNINHFKLLILDYRVVINYNREWNFIQHIIPSFLQYHLMASCAYTNHRREGTGSRLCYTYYIYWYYIDINSIMIILLTCLPIAYLLLSNLHPKYKHYDDPLGQLCVTTHC